METHLAEFPAAIGLRRAAILRLFEDVARTRTLIDNCGYLLDLLDDFNNINGVRYIAIKALLQ